MTPFPIPNLPTDNLYKFYALSGIFIAIFSLTAILLTSSGLEREIRNLELKEQTLKLDSLYYQDYSVQLDAQYDKIEDMLKSFPSPDSVRINHRKEYLQQLVDIRSDPSWREYLEFIFKYEDKIVPGQSELKEIDEILEEMEVSAKNLELKTAELKITKSGLRYEKKKLTWIYVFGIIFFLFGSLLSFLGFRLWKNRVQKLIDKKNKIELKLLKQELKNNSQS